MLPTQVGEKNWRRKGVSSKTLLLLLWHQNLNGRRGCGGGSGEAERRRGQKYGNQRCDRNLRSPSLSSSSSSLCFSSWKEKEGDGLLISSPSSPAFLPFSLEREELTCGWFHGATEKTDKVKKSHSCDGCFTANNAVACSAIQPRIL